MIWPLEDPADEAMVEKALGVIKDTLNDPELAPALRVKAAEITFRVFQIGAYGRAAQPQSQEIFQILGPEKPEGEDDE